MHAITDHDFAQGQGGFWVKANGDLLHVEHYAEHIDTLSREGFNASYREAYERGWVRISTYRNSRQEHRSISVNFNTDFVSVQALQQAAKIIRHKQMADWAKYEWQAEYDHYEHPQTGRSWEAFNGNENGQDKLARLIMGHAMRRNAVIKRAEAEKAEAEAEAEAEWQYVPTTDQRIFEGELVHKLLTSIDAALARELTPSEMAQ